MLKKYIEAEKLIRDIDGSECLDTERDYEEIARRIDECEAADVEDVKHGEWIEDTSPHYGIRFICNKCKVAHATIWVGVNSISYTVGGNTANYCPNCGAKMDGKESNE